MSKLVSDVKLYAKLLNSVGVQGTGNNQKRPLPPVECAKLIQRLIDEEDEPLDKIAEMLNLGKPKTLSNMYKKHDTTQINTFLNLLKVSEKSRDLAGWQTDEYPKIPFSVIAQLSSMVSDEQDMIIQSIFEARDKKIKIGKEDVKKIKKWRNENSDLPIQECIEKVLKLKPVEITTNIVVCGINEMLQKFIMTNTDYREKLLDILKNNLDGKFHNIDTGKSVIAISMDDEAYKIFYEHQYKKDISYAEFLDKFLEDKIG